jgi:hypothetical protein
MRMIRATTRDHYRLLSYGRWYGRLSTASGSLSSALVNTDRVSTVKDLLVLQVFYPLRGARGRCGRYINDLYGYIDIVQVNRACCLLISRR